MATIVPRPPVLSPLSTINSLSFPKPSARFTTIHAKPSSNLKCFKVLSSSDESPQPSAPSPPEASSTSKPDPVKLAFERAKAYKKSTQPNPPKNTNEYRQNSEIGATGNGNGVSDSSKIDSLKLGYDEAQINNSIVKMNQLGIVNENADSASVSEGKKEVPVSVKMAMERAKEYKKNGGIGSTSGKEALPGIENVNKGSIGSGSVEKKTSIKKTKPTISSIDFVGLGFADKKEGRGLPAGLIPIIDPYPEGDMADVEFIAGDSTMFGEATQSNTESTEEESSDLYKPRVSTWGVFPRPSNISKTFGGGRVVRPGEVLETEEDKAAKLKRTRQLLTAYKKKMGLNIDPKLKSECEKALTDGDSQMDRGNLKQALPFYEEVMNNLPFQSELHGLAALQWSICQDSLNRTNEARVMYEKLQSHPKVEVSKKARQFIFSFQAMEMMRVTNSSTPSYNTDYKNYFEKFIENQDNIPIQDPEVEEGAFTDSFPYILFLLAPIFMVLFIAVQKRL